MVGDERAVAAAARGVGPEALAAALPLLQAPALTRETRAAAGPKRKELHALLKNLGQLGATAANTDVPPLEELHRVKTSNLLMAIGMFIAAGALLSQVGDPADLWDTVTRAKWEWLAVAFILSMSTNIGFAIALMGTVPIRLPLWRTTELQVSMSFSNLAVPAVGGMAAQIRFLQKQRADLASAIASGGLLSSVASPVVQLAIFGVAISLTPDPVNFVNIPTSSIVDLVLAVIVVALVAAGIVFGIPKIRKAALPPLKQAATTLWTALRSPRQLSLLFVGNFASTIIYGFCLMACIEAFGHSPSIWTPPGRQHRRVDRRIARADPGWEYRGRFGGALRRAHGVRCAHLGCGLGRAYPAAHRQLCARRHRVVRDQGPARPRLPLSVALRSVAVLGIPFLGLNDPAALEVADQAGNDRHQKHLPDHGFEDHQQPATVVRGAKPLTKAANHSAYEPGRGGSAQSGMLSACAAVVIAAFGALTADTNVADAVPGSSSDARDWAAVCAALSIAR